jgi:hypothetical protein
MAILVASHFGTVLGTSGNAANLASSCITPTSTPAASTPPASTGPSSTPTTVPTPTAQPATPAAVPTATATGTAMPAAGGSANAAAATPLAAATPTASATATAPASTPAVSATAAPPAATPTVSATATPPAATPTTTATATPASTPAPSATATPTASATATPAASATATPCPSSTPTTPVPVANVSCDIIVPANPLSAQGLATPYQLTGTDGASPTASGCTEANAVNLGAFVQATILNPATGALWVYEPLVITQGTTPATPAAPPVVPTLPARAIVTIDFGFNGTNLTQVGATPTALRQGHCLDGLDGSVFGQVSFCNGRAFFRAARRAEARGRLVVPSAGTSPKTGQACPTTRNFNMIDQDPSDNVTTDYLLTASGQTAQFNPANESALPGATNIVNGSDNKLLTAFIDPTLGCTPLQAPDLSQSGAPGTSQALNELSAAASHPNPAALVPENDEMTLVNNAPSVAKTNLYRINVGQPMISAANNAADSPAMFCQNMVNMQTPFLSANQALLATGSSPVPSVGDNLLTFLANRLSMSFANLSCQGYGLTNPVTVTLNSAGAATGATFNVTQQQATDPSARPSVPLPTAPPGRHHHGRRSRSGM